MAKGWTKENYSRDRSRGNSIPGPEKQPKMRQSQADPKNSVNLLDTLAQRETRQYGLNVKNDLIIVTGNGTKTSNVVQLKGWAKRKIITQAMMLALIDVCKAKGKTDRLQPYWNTYHCLDIAHSSDGLLYGKYCKNRFCTVCLCIRKAEIINKFMPVVRKWTEPYFVTLTIRSVSRERLALIFDKMIQGFKRIKDRRRKRSQRKVEAKKLVGIRSLECNFNAVKRTYNPHFHLIVSDRETAIIFIDEWCKLWTRKWAGRNCQHTRKVKNLEKDLIECVKYGTKIFTEPDVNKKVKQRGTSHIYVSALDNILSAMKGHRLFDRFGFNLPKESADKTAKFTPLTQYDEWIFSPHHKDWMNPETAEILTDYHPNQELQNLLKFNLNLNLE